MQAKKLKTLEQHAIDLALSNKHLNPRFCDAQNTCLTADGANRKITEYLFVDASSIIANNIRYEDIDISYCKTELGPLILRKHQKDPQSGGLNYPIFVVRRGNKYEIVHGHNRFWVLVNILKLTEIPIFVIEDTGTPMQKLTAKILANSKKEDDHRKY